MGFPVKAPEETDLEGFTKEYRLHATQSTYKASEFTLSRYFEIIGGHTLRVSLGPRSDYVYINEYNKNYQILKRHHRNAPPTNIQLGSDTMYIRFAPYTVNLDNCYVYDLTDKNGYGEVKTLKDRINEKILQRSHTRVVHRGSIPHKKNREWDV